MSTAKKKARFRVRVDNRHLTVFDHPNGWRFGWKDGTRWRYVTRRKRSAIIEAAEDVLREQDTSLVWSGLSPARQAFFATLNRELAPGDEEALLAYLSSRKRSAKLADSVERYKAWKTEENGGLSNYHEGVMRFLDGLSGAFPGRAVSDITADELERWWRVQGEGKGPKRRRDQRAMLVVFWKWCQREGIAGSDPLTPAARLPSPKVATGEKRIITSAELVAILNETRHEFRAQFALGAWAGLRPEEIHPGPKSRTHGKRGLHCEEIDWRFNVIRIPAEVSKVRLPRVVPLTPILKTALRWAGIEEGMTGPVAVKDPVTCRETTRLGKLIFKTGWPKDALRHSYGSYRNATVRNLPQVAEEMGTSVAMLNRHYHNPQSPEIGAAWFDSITLQRPIMSDFDDSNGLRCPIMSDFEGRWIVEKAFPPSHSLPVSQQRA